MEGHLRVLASGLGIAAGLPILTVPGISTDGSVLSINALFPEITREGHEAGRLYAINSLIIFDGIVKSSNHLPPKGRGIGII
jgi:hypothetical protein